MEIVLIFYSTYLAGNISYPILVQLLHLKR